MEMPKPKPTIPAPSLPVPSLYGTKSNRQLLEIARGYEALPEANQAALREEFASRGLEPPLIEDRKDNEQETATVGEPASFLVTVGTYRDLSEAIVARAVLEQAGIECFLQDENMIRLDWAISNAIGGLRLQVSNKDAAQATALLSQPIPASFATDSGAEFHQPVCPKCGSLDVMVNDTDRKIGMTGIFLAGLPLIGALPTMAIQRKDVWKCLNCGCRWYDDGLPEGPATGTDSAPLR
jgi:predicted nucleic-acid-binding Zn-ribbon protein